MKLGAFLVATGLSLIVFAACNLTAQQREEIAVRSAIEAGHLGCIEAKQRNMLLTPEEAAYCGLITINVAPTASAK